MNELPKLTIGIATLDDHEGLWFTLQSLLMYHGLVMEGVQVVVVDQAPESAHGSENAKLIEKKLKRRAERESQLHSVTYIPMAHPRGIGPARNRLFAEANAEIVLVMDSHVLLELGVLERLFAYYQKRPECRDLLIGPLLSDSGGFVGTHQDLNWRSEALGTWARDPELYDRDAEPKEVPMQGLGVFSCRKAAYPGFHSEQRGFGCAEAIFAEKFRRRGDRVLCLPFLRWLHRFTRINGPPYPVRRQDKVFNYLVEMLSLEMDPSDLFDHFSGKLTSAEMQDVTRRLRQLGLLSPLLGERT